MSAIVTNGKQPTGTRLNLPINPQRPANWSRRSELWSRCFGTSTVSSVILRTSADFFLANVVLVMAAVLRLVVTGGISLDNPVGTLLGKVNTLYLINVGWFCGSVLVLYVLSNVYKPVPTARVKTRLWYIARACLIGCPLHIAFGWVLRIGPQTVEVCIPAWSILFLTTGSMRCWRMYFGSRYQMIRRDRVAHEQMETVLIVGGAGYIGSVLTRQLLDAGYRVRILDLQLFGIESLSTMLSHPRLEVMKGDFRNVEDVVRALRGIDAIVHLAAIVGDPACALDKDTTIAVNYAAAKMMTQLARANGISRFVFASTCSVYGASEELRDETSELNPVSLYATTKIDAERVLLEAADDVFRPTILRFATAYGWSLRPRFDLVANLLSAQAVTERKITIFNGEQWRPFVHTEDIARACHMVLEAPLNKVGAQIFNVGDEDQNFTLQQLGQIVAAAHPGTHVSEVRNDEDPRNYRVRFDKIRTLLGYRASVHLKDGIKEIVDAVRLGKVNNWRDPVHSNIRHLEDEGLVVLKIASGDGNELEEMQVTREFLARAA